MTNYRPIDSVGPPVRETSLIHISNDPLLLESSDALITPSQCDILTKYFQSKLQVDAETGSLLTSCDMNQNAYENDLIRNEPGAIILRDLQNVLLKLLGLDSSEAVLPRYIYYTENDRDLSEHTNNVRNNLLPDGLHVDSNNGKFFRHWTVLLYLTSNPQSGATIFPLIQNQYIKNSILDFEMSDFAMAATQAEKLIISGVHHTRLNDLSFENKKLATQLEDYAVHCIINNPSSCVRVMPCQGHVCIFSGLKDNGFPHHLSFHGGENVFPKTTSNKGKSIEQNEKHVLTFFYEVPIHTFRNRSELGAQVKQREDIFKTLHDLV